jgi:RNA polymerase sigma-70 factor, ECF subfamily
VQNESHLVIVPPPGPLTLTLDDAALVERARGDDEAAFTALYHRYAHYVAGVVYQLIGDDAEVDDIVQETFVDAKAGLTDIEEPPAVRRWLVVIAIRRVQRVLLRRRVRRWYTRRAAELSPRASDPRDAAPVEELYDALDRIPAKLRVPWILAHLAGMPLAEAAGACEVSLATLKRRIVEADQRLARKLAP